MVTTPLDMKYIYRRERGLERKRNLNESASFRDFQSLSPTSSYNYKIRVEDFINSCSSYKDAVSILEDLYASDNFNLLEATTQKVISDIIPMVESAELPDCIEYIKESHIGDVNKDRLIETAKIYKSVDRIRKNHKNLSKRFEMTSMKGKSNKAKCFSICEMVDTYSMNRFIKFNIALEELVYLGYMNGDLLIESDMVAEAANYFLLIGENTQEDIDSYRRAIESSKVISEGADSEVKFLMNPEAYSESTFWYDKLNNWKMNPDKDIPSLVELARENYSNFSALNEIFSTMDDYLKINNISFDKMTIFKEFTSGIDKDAARNIMDIIKEDNINDPENLVESLRTIWEAELNDEVYADGTTKPETFTSDEIDKFTMHNMMVDAQNVGEFLDQLEKTSMKESPLKISKILSADDTNLDESNLVDHIDANGFMNMKLRSYAFDGPVEEAYKLVNSSVSCINNMLYGRRNKAYFTIGENYFDISIRSDFKVILTETEEIKRGVSTSDKELICDISKYVSVSEAILSSRFQGIIEKLTEDRSFAAMVTPQEAAFIYEMINPYIDKENSPIEEFVQLCKDEANPKYDRIKQEISLVKEEAFDINEDHLSRINFCADYLGISEGVADNLQKAIDDIKKPFQKNKQPQQQQAQASTPVEEPKKEEVKKQRPVKDNTKKPVKDEDDDEDSEKEEKSAPSGEDTSKKAINSLNDAKLAWQGIKAKLKGASAKEQEMSRDLDMEFNHMLKTLKNTYGTDHREEIITGEVNHSLSKIIKIGIGLAGIGIACGSAVIPAIGAVALFAKSKFTSNKEKKMILDEIDIELKVLEREIQRAEGSGSTKKYRQLLTIQRNLMRRRQEIYYGLAKKGQRIPMQATAGLRDRE